MKVLRYCVFLLFLLSASSSAYSQCAMCSANAENSVKNGNTQGKGLNDGILYLLAAPYIAVAAIGYLWYKKYRKKNAGLQQGKINFNGHTDVHS